MAKGVGGFARGTRRTAARPCPARSHRGRERTSSRPGTIRLGAGFGTGRYPVPTRLGWGCSPAPSHPPATGVRADYCCWAVFRKWQRGESAWYDRIKPAAAERVRDLNPWNGSGLHQLLQPGFPINEISPCPEGRWTLRQKSDPPDYSISGECSPGALVIGGEPLLIYHIEQSAVFRYRQ